MILNLFHKHYWGTPIKHEDGHYYMTCYECGKERLMKLDFNISTGEWIEVKSNLYHHYLPEKEIKTKKAAA
jgi:hypothetical protein